MNMFKKNGGFTLVELIVVIAILAILASVAIPVYSGYINKATAVQDDPLIASLETGLNSAAAFNGTSYPTVTISFDDDEATFTFATGADAIAKTFSELVEGSYTAETNGAAATVKVDGFKYATGLSYADGQLSIATHK